MTPHPELSTVIAPADATFWARIYAAYDAALDKIAWQPHTCTDVCRPYRGPIRLGRRGETITPGRTT